MRRFAAAALAATALVSACGTGGMPQDELQAVDNPVAATPARSPAANPEGELHRLPGAASAALADPRSGTLAVALRRSAKVLLYPMDRPGAGPREVRLPAPADSLNLAGAGGPLLASVGSANTVVEVPLPGGQAKRLGVPGNPVDAVRDDGRTLVAVRDAKGVRVLGAGSGGTTISGGLYSADQVFSVSGRTLVLDRVRNALFEVDLRTGEVGKGQRTGEGAGTATTDRYGRVLVADTRGDALLAFSTDPLLMRQRYPVDGAPYAVAYDRRRDLVWVTLTERNEVVGYHVAGGQPDERYRFRSVRQPNAVTVDSHTGRVFVVSATGDGMQVVQP